MFARVQIRAEKLCLGGPFFVVTVNFRAQVLIPLLEAMRLDLLQKTLLALLRLANRISGTTFTGLFQTKPKERRSRRWKYSQHGSAAVIRGADVVVRCLQRMLYGRPVKRITALVNVQRPTQARMYLVHLRVSMLHLFTSLRL